MNASPTDYSVYNDYPVRKEAVPQPRQTEQRGLSPRAKAGIAVGGVVLAATGMVCWSQYETAQANADVKKAQLSLQQAQVQLAIQQQAAQQAKASGQETPAQKARREALQQCIAAAGNSYNGVQDCANAYPATDSTALNDTQATASSTPTGGTNSGTGLLVLGGAGVLVVGAWVKKRVLR